MYFTADALEARANQTTTPCEAATRQWEDAREWSQRLMFLVYVVSAAVVGAVLVLIVMAFLNKPAGRGCRHHCDGCDRSRYGVRHP